MYSNTDHVLFEGDDTDVDDDDGDHSEKTSEEAELNQNMMLLNLFDPSTDVPVTPIRLTKAPTVSKKVASSSTV